MGFVRRGGPGLPAIIPCFLGNFRAGILTAELLKIDHSKEWLKISGETLLEHGDLCQEGPKIFHVPGRKLGSKVSNYSKWVISPQYIPCIIHKVSRENQCLEDDISFQIGPFCGDMLIFLGGNPLILTIDPNKPVPGHASTYSKKQVLDRGRMGFQSHHHQNPDFANQTKEAN